MAQDWLASLSAETRSKVEQMVAQMTELGAEDAESWIQSEIEEDIPQFARFLVLRRLWRGIDAWRDGSSAYVARLIADAEDDPDGYFADAGLAIKRMREAGVTPEDIGAVARFVAYEATFETLNVIDEGYDPEVEEEAPGWRLIEADTSGELTARHIDGLHESLLSLDPSGREGRPIDE